MVKRIMGLILTGTMIMSLLACGKADTDTAKTTQSDSNSSISSSSEDASNSEGDVITFTFAEHVADIENQAPQVYAVVQEFMKQNPDIKIEMTGAAQDEHTQKIKLASQSDSLPVLPVQSWRTSSTRLHSVPFVWDAPVPHRKISWRAWKSSLPAIRRKTACCPTRKS